jgi:hypothetical protein
MQRKQALSAIKQVKDSWNEPNPDQAAFATAMGC